MKVAVVTPYYKESLETLRRCHDSVMAQTHPCTHVMIADGHARSEVSQWPVDHLQLPFSHGDYGNTPRSIGGMSVLNRGFDAIAYLDGDNWFHPEHVESLIDLVQSEKVPMAFSDRFIVSIDGTLMRNLPEDDSPRFTDTSCIFHTMEAARMIPIWAMMEPNLPIMGDKVFAVVAETLGIRHARTRRRTLYYETNHIQHYLYNDIPPPAGATNLNFEAAIQAYSETDCRERTGLTLKFRN